MPGADCRAEDAALLATGRDQPKAGARPGDGQSLKRPAALSALPLNWPAAEPRAGLDTTPGGWLAGVDDDKAAKDLIEALHDLLDGLDAGEFDDLEWVRLAQISDLTRTGTQSEAIVLPEDLVGDRLRAQHCRIRSAITTGWAECSGCGCSARSRRMRSTSDDLQRAHSAESAQVSEMVPSSGRQASSMSKSASRCSSVTPCRAATSAMRQSTKLCMVYPRARPVR